MAVKGGSRGLLAMAGVLAPVLALLALLGYGFTRETKFIPTPFLGRAAPDFELALLDGTPVRLADLRGKAVFLNFWASWCPPCRAEARMLEAVWRRRQDGDVVFLGVNIQDREENARAFIREFGVTYPNGMDRRSRIAVDYGVWGIPETFFIDREGRITYKHVGALGEATIEAKLAEALGGVVSKTEGRGEYTQIQ